MKNKISKSMRFFSITGSLVILAACSGPEPTPWVEEQYQEHAADIKKIFGNEVKEDSEQTYVATKVSNDMPGPGYDGSGWRLKYELTLKTTKETKRVGNKEQPVLVFTAKLPEGINAWDKEVAPETGSFALGDKTGYDIKVNRFKGNAQDEKFKDGTLSVLEDGRLVLTYEHTFTRDTCLEADRSCGSIVTTWTFELKKKED